MDLALPVGRAFVAPGGRPVVRLLSLDGGKAELEIEVADLDPHRAEDGGARDGAVTDGPPDAVPPTAGGATDANELALDAAAPAEADSTGRIGGCSCALASRQASAFAALTTILFALLAGRRWPRARPPERS